MTTTPSKISETDLDCYMLPDSHHDDTDFQPDDWPRQLTISDWLIIAGGVLAVVILAMVALIVGCNFCAPRGLMALWSML
jgi:hypothetical protein